MTQRLVSVVAAVGLMLALGLAGHQQATGQSPATSGPKVYVGLFKDDAVAVVDPVAGRVLGKISVPRGPHGLVITPDGRKVYVSSDGASSVSVIDTATDRVTATVDVGPNPHGLAMSNDGRRVLVSAFGANAALLIDTATDAVAGRVPVAQPHNGAFAPDRRTAYVGSQQQGGTALVILDLVDAKEVARVPLARTPRALDVSPDGRWLYLTLAGSDAVQVLDTASRQIVGEIPVGASPHFALFAPGGGTGLVVSQGPGELAILDASTRAVRGVVPVGKAPHWVAAGGDGKTAYVSNEGSNDMSVVDLGTRAVTATIPVGNAPRKIAVQPGPAGKAASPHAVSAAAQAPRSLKLGTLTFTDQGLKDAKGAREVEIEADDYYFKPTFVRGTPGQTLTFEVENESGTLHNISMPAQGIDRDIPPKAKVTVEVVVPASGVVAFTCKFHSALGMNGQLLAGDASPQPVSAHDQRPTLAATGQISR